MAAYTRHALGGLDEAPLLELGGRSPTAVEAATTRGGTPSIRRNDRVTETAGLSVEEWSPSAR